MTFTPRQRRIIQNVGRNWRGRRSHRTVGNAMSSRTHRQLSEQAIQREVFRHLRTRAAPGVFAFHVPMGGYRKPIEAAIMKGIGVVAGVPDVFIVHAGRCFTLELKAEGGRASDKQLACIAALREAGAFTCIAEGLDRALACLEAWGLLVGRSQ
jgi:hypothetical protein